MSKTDLNVLRHLAIRLNKIESTLLFLEKETYNFVCLFEEMKKEINELKAK